MSDVLVIIQIMFITIGMVILGIVLNYLLGLRKNIMSELREKALNLQERMRNAQLMSDFQQLSQLQRESVLFMKQMMKKQMLPMCIRCIIFIGIFIVLGFIYSDYNSGLLPFPLLFFGSGWVAIYLIFSISFSLIIFGGKKLYYKITGKEIKTQSSLKQIMGIISPMQQESESSFQLPGAISSDTQYRFARQKKSSLNNEEESSREKLDSWKERIKK